LSVRRRTGTQPRTLGLLLAAACALATSACAGPGVAPAHERLRTPGPDEVGPRAAADCPALLRSADLPSRPFTTDACSLFPDGDWADCCIAHDIAYWCGGSFASRRAADRRLRACVAARHGGCGGRTLGALMEAGVFFGGSPWLPTPWRWGYGHRYPAGYANDVRDDATTRRSRAEEPDGRRPVPNTDD